jgi:hypothetical protein
MLHAEANTSVSIPSDANKTGSIVRRSVFSQNVVTYSTGSGSKLGPDIYIIVGVHKHWAPDRPDD